MHTTQREDKNLAEAVRNSLMAVLTLIFVFLYAAAFSGKLDPLKDNSMLLQFEPVIFLLIGYYFGRFAARKSERVLKDEIRRQAQRIDAAQYAKEKVQKDCESLEEKIRNAQTALKTERHGGGQSGSVKATLAILDS